MKSYIGKEFHESKLQDGTMEKCNDLNILSSNFTTYMYKPLKEPNSSRILTNLQLPNNDNMLKW